MSVYSIIWSSDRYGWLCGRLCGMEAVATGRGLTLLFRINCHKSLQNSVRKKSRFCSFSSRLWCRKGLTAFDCRVVWNGFLRRHGAGRALRPFRSEDFAGFLLTDFVRKSCRFSAVRALRGHSGAAFVVWRQPCCNAAGAPLQTNKGLTATLSRRRCFPTVMMPFVNDW